MVCPYPVGVRLAMLDAFGAVLRHTALNDIFGVPRARKPYFPTTYLKVSQDDIFGVFAIRCHLRSGDYCRILTTVVS